MRVTGCINNRWKYSFATRQTRRHRANYRRIPGKAGQQPWLARGLYSLHLTLLRL